MFNNLFILHVFLIIFFVHHKIWRPLLPAASTAWSGTLSELRRGRQKSVTWPSRENGSVDTRSYLTRRGLTYFARFVLFVLCFSFQCAFSLSPLTKRCGEDQATK